MAKNLKTEFKRIGRSGPTVDGRVIEPDALRQAAKNYDKDVFTALIWPEHERWYNMGTVEALQVKDNTEGGVDLYAELAPNDYFKSINQADQKLFTSMELMPNFRDSGEYYLTGLAATDSPASAGTQELRFSALNNKKALLSEFTEQKSMPDEDRPPRWFTRLFTPSQSEIDTMSKELTAALAPLLEKFNQLEKKLDAVTAEPVTSTLESTENEDYSTLAQSVSDLTAKFSELESKLTEHQSAEAVNALRDDVKQLRDEFKQALTTEHGTDAGDHTGDTDDLSNYL